MDVQFQKTVVPYLQTIVNQTQSQEETQQVRLSDAMPDIGKVLLSWGQVLIRGKQWRSDSVSLSGGVKIWVLYEPEDGTAPRCVETWLPFQMKWDIPDTDRDGTIIACPMTPDVEARMLSDRKLMVRANVSVRMCAMVPEEALMYLPETVPEDVQILKNTYPMLVPVESGEKAFDMEERISLPAEEQPMETLLRYTLEPMLAESKLVADKLVMRGIARLRMLYLGTDGGLHSWGMELPFSQYTQLDDQYDPDAKTQICFGVTGLEMETDSEGQMTMRAGITGQYTVFDRKEITAVEDMYSPSRTVDPSFDELYIPSVLDTQSHTLRAETAPENMPVKMTDAVFVPGVPQVQMTEDGMQAQLAGVFRLLGTDMEGNVSAVNSRWEDQWTLPASENAQMRLVVEPVELPQYGGSDVWTELRLNADTVMQQPIRIVTGAELGETATQDAQRPSLVLRRAGDASLWELAKQNGSTVEAIQKINGLQQEPAANQMLLIPVI